MRVLALTNLYPNPLQPQRAPFNRHQFRLLAQHHSLRVIAPVPWTDELAAFRKTGQVLPRARRVVHDGLVVDHPRYWYTPRVFRSLYGRFFLKSVERAFAGALQEFQPQLVFAPWAYPDGWAAVQLARRARLPVVVQVHGSDIREVNKHSGRLAGTVAALRGANGVIAVSRDLAERVVALGAAPEAVRTVVDGVDWTLFCPGDRQLARQRLAFEPGRRHLLFVGNLVAVKGVDILLQALARLNSRNRSGSAVPDWQLHLVGEGRLQPTLVALGRTLGISGQVSFHGTVCHAELPDWFRAADLFVLPSRSEGIPNVLLEASACGTPYVASAVGGIPEIAHLGTSRLVPPGDVEALAAALDEQLNEHGEHALHAPATGPRDRQESVREIADFLLSVQRHAHEICRTEHDPSLAR